MYKMITLNLEVFFKKNSERENMVLQKAKFLWKKL